MLSKAILAAIVPLALVLLIPTTSDAATKSGITAPKYSASDCLSCHNMAQGLNHPNGVPTKNSAGLPLSKNGKVDCLTCHTDEARNPDHSFRLSGQPSNDMLRAKGRILCASCHDPETDPGTVLGHGLTMGKAHLQFEKPFSGGLMDPETRMCLSCHDGSAASSSGVRVGNGSPSHSSYNSIRSNHPINVEYDWVPKGTMAPQYHPTHMLPEQIRLFKGRLGCGSCHTTYSELDHMLAGDPKRGTLCLSCHIK